MPASTLIISQYPAAASGFRQLLAQLGWECPLSNVLSLESAGSGLTAAGASPRYVFLICPQAPDDSPQQVSWLRERTSARLIVVGPMNDPHRVLDAVHQGADDYLDHDHDLPAQLHLCLERLRRKEQTTSGIGRVIAVAAPCGGSGASFVAANLAASIAQRGAGCTLLDLDARHGDQAALFNLSPRHTLADLWRHLDSLDANMLEQSLTRHECGVRVLAAPEDSTEGRRIDGRCLERIIQLSRAASSVTLLDLPTALDEHHLDLLKLCDACVVVFRLDFPSLRNLRRLLAQLDQREIDAQRVNLVANRCGLPKELSAGKIRAALQRDIRLTIEDDPELANLTVNCGAPAVLESPKSSAAVAFKQLAEIMLPTTAAGTVANAASGGSTTLMEFVKSRLLKGEKSRRPRLELLH